MRDRLSIIFFKYCGNPYRYSAACKSSGIYHMDYHDVGNCTCAGRHNKCDSVFPDAANRGCIKKNRLQRVFLRY